LIGHHKQIKTHKREENKDPYRRRKEAQGEKSEEKTRIKKEREERNKRGRKIWWSLVKVIISLERKGKLGLEKEE
jgi:hypothetical protein